MNRFRLFQTVVIILTIGGLLVAPGCSLTGGGATVAPPSTATVTRGDLTTYISASGNISYPDTQDIRLQVGGTVSEVLVKAGDMVKEGDLLVRLDDSTLQDKIKSDQLAVNSARIALEKVTNTYKQKTYPYSYNTFAVDIPYAVGALNSAGAKVTSARDTLAKAKTLSEMSDAQTQLTNALKDLDDALNKLTFGQGDSLFQLDALGKKAALVGSDYWSLRTAQLDIQNAQASLDNAENNLENDRSDLDKTILKAPFDGLITGVAATDGAVMNINNVAVTMTNPDKLEADVLVNEIDIFNVKINGPATVAVDAISGLTVPAAVTYIQPTATIQSGVVNYGVTVELKPGAAAATPASLRQGLSVTVNIVKTTNNNVLLVPNRAIIRQGTATTAQVVSGSGAIEVRTITTGAGDNRNTEVTRGLAEGEKVVIQAAANRTSTPAAGGMFGGGGGRPPFAGGSMGGS